MNTYNIADFSRMVGVTVKTLQRWDRNGTLVPTRTPTGRRVYTGAHLAQATGLKTKIVSRKVVAYVRVSSQAQKADLDNQSKTLADFALQSDIKVDDWISEIGGGLNFQRKKFLSIIDEIVAGRVSTLVIAHKDRLARFGFELIEHLCKTHDCRLVVMDNESLSPEQEMIQDMLAVVHCFSARLYGLRNYRKALRKALENDTRAQDQTQSDN